jgi:hypothetical protein
LRNTAIDCFLRASTVNNNRHFFSNFNTLS